nr:MAG TPA: hypothetical protein [Caudoviricetes sp.]
MSTVFYMHENILSKSRKILLNSIKTHPLQANNINVNCILHA